MEKSIEVKKVESNGKTTKKMISSNNARKVTEEGKFPCVICRKGIEGTCANQ